MFTISGVKPPWLEKGGIRPTFFPGNKSATVGHFSGCKSVHSANSGQ